MIPPRSPIFINPSHKDRTPVSPNDISKAVLAEVNEEFMISFQIVRFPKNTDWITATPKAIRKKDIQI